MSWESHKSKFKSYKVKWKWCRAILLCDWHNKCSQSPQSQCSSVKT